MQIEKIISGKLDNNTYILKNDKKQCLIIDAAANLEDIIQKVGDFAVEGVLLTHGHYDHFVNLDSIIKHYQTKCYISEIELEKLYNPKMNYSIVFNTFYSSKLEEEHFVKLQDQNEFLLGNFKVKTMLTPGHTSGCMCYLINNTYLFTGDTLFKSSHGRTDLLTSSSDQMSKSLKFLKNNFSGQTFYPGHGEEGIVNN